MAYHPQRFQRFPQNNSIQYPNANREFKGKFQGNCFYCGKFGHSKKDCRHFLASMQNKSNFRTTAVIDNAQNSENKGTPSNAEISPSTNVRFEGCSMVNTRNSVVNQVNQKR